MAKEEFVEQRRPMKVMTPAGRDALLIRGFSGTEAISQLFHFTVDLFAENHKNISFDQIVGQKLTVIAWLWARTVKSPNPAFREDDVPLASTFMLSTKPGKEAWVEPVIEDGGYRFTVRVGKPENAEEAIAGNKLGGRGANFGCLMSGAPIAADYILHSGKSGRPPNLSRFSLTIRRIRSETSIWCTPSRNFPSNRSPSRSARRSWKSASLPL